MAGQALACGLGWVGGDGQALTLSFLWLHVAASCQVSMDIPRHPVLLLFFQREEEKEKEGGEEGGRRKAWQAGMRKRKGKA